MWSVYILNAKKKQIPSIVVYNFLKNIKNNKRLFLCQIMGRVEGLLLFLFFLIDRKY